MVTIWYLYGKIWMEGGAPSKVSRKNFYFLLNFLIWEKYLEHLKKFLYMIARYIKYINYKLHMYASQHSS